jgi:hypothetical protein
MGHICSPAGHTLHAFNTNTLLTVLYCYNVVFVIRVLMSYIIPFKISNCWQGELCHKASLQSYICELSAVDFGFSYPFLYLTYYNNFSSVLCSCREWRRLHNKELNDLY